jgi:chromosome segregation ATPase
MDNKLLISLAEKIDKLQNSINKLQKEIEKMNLNQTKMSQHIDFVENIYENVKHPLGYVCHKISSVMGNEIKSQNTLPSIQNGN